MGNGNPRRRRKKKKREVEFRVFFGYEMGRGEDEVQSQNLIAANSLGGWSIKSSIGFWFLSLRVFDT